MNMEIKNCCAPNGSHANDIYCTIFMNPFGVIPASRKEISHYNVTQNRSPDLYYDIKIVMLVAIGLTFARVILQKFSAAMARNGYFTVKKQPKDKKLEDTVLKFSESFWKICFYSFSMMWGWWLCYSNKYHEDIQRVWYKVDAFGKYGPDDNIWYFYIFELAAYVSMLFCQLFLEVERKDFYVMLLHHCTTILLVGLSHVAGAHEIGICVLASHDVNDVLLEVAKLVLYQGRELLANIVFGIFVVLWVVFRLYLFPFHIIHTSLFHGNSIAGCFVYHGTLTFLLVVLMPMHYYWFVLILQTAWKAMQGHYADVREENDSKKNK